MEKMTIERNTYTQEDYVVYAGNKVIGFIDFTTGRIQGYYTNDKCCDCIYEFKFEDGRSKFNNDDEKYFHLSQILISFEEKHTKYLLINL